MRIPYLIALVACANPNAVTTKVTVPLTAASATSAMVTTRDDLTPAWTLTASDGSGLVLARVDVKAVLEGPLAFTELHLYFRNDEPRAREGTFQITLPQRAAISRFAMENAGQWLEAEVVPKQLARRVYEDFLHRRQDPALLEKAAGNQFTARVFPIAASSEKHLVISYSQELPGMRYALPLRGLPAVERIDVELAVGGRVEQLAERNWQPDRDFVSSVATAPAVSAGALVAAQVELGGTATRDVPRGITLLVDTSASRTLGFTAYVAAVRKLIAELPAIPLDVIAFDQDCELVFNGRASEFGDAHVKQLAERGAAGASDLGQALAWTGKRGVQPRVVIVGDGVITAGIEGAELNTAAKQLRAERFDVVLAGGLRDERTGSLIANAGLRAGAVLDLEIDRVAVALAESVVTDVSIDVPGATWVHPRRIASARAGTKLTVFARLASPATSIDIVAGGAPLTLPVVAGTAPLIERAVASAEIAELETRLASVKGDTAAALRAAIAKQSVAMRVLSSETSLLVLETEDDYKRYSIERKALADVLVVGPRGVTRQRRSDVVVIGGRDAEPDLVAGARRDVARTDYGPDNDRDGILDDVDGCPDAAENVNNRDDTDGCPDRGHVIMSNASITILQAIQFEHDRALIKRESYPILDAVAATFQGNADIELVEIAGHTDERGDDTYNLDLSKWRAEAVKQYLVSKGVAESRLEVQGYGEAQPLDRGHNDAAWAKNRRVEFLILKRAGGSTPTEPAAPPPPPPPPPAPVTGELAAIQSAIASGDLDGAYVRARNWHAREPANLLALIGFGEALEARHADATAARIYGSIIDLFPNRADLRRFAGERLGRIASAQISVNAQRAGGGAGELRVIELVIDTYRRAVADRPDHLTGHRLLAYALVRANKPADAFAAILAGLEQKTYRQNSYSGGLRVLREDAAMIGAVYASAVPVKRAEIAQRLAKHDLALATQPSTRFVVYWETDANDVDLHIRDSRGGHAFYSQPKLASGGELYADVTTGYGPECFVIPGTPSGPYQLSLEYYAQGPMGFGMGLLQIQTFDPTRGLTFEDRPYVIMTARAKLDLGVYR